MKKVKKYAGLFLALVMVFAMTTSAFAYTITIVGDEKSPTEGHTYNVYQIFTGTLAKDEDEQEFLTAIKYGQNYTPGEVAVGDWLAYDDFVAIEDAHAFAKKLVDEELLEGEAMAVLNKDNNWTKTDLPAGYYLIQDVTENLPEGHTLSAYIICVVKDVTVTPKSSVVEVEKKVKDINDSQDASIDDNDWTDTADHDVNDRIPYQITSKIVSIDEHSDYKVTFYDTMSKGLTYDDNAVITLKYTAKNAEGETVTQTIDATDDFIIASADYVVPAGVEDDKYEGGKVYTFTCVDIKALAGEGNNMTDAEITIAYTATLNENAEVGALGNPNKVHLEYDRNPEPGEYEAGITPDDVNVVFTFKVDVNKVDQDKKPLFGAEFKLEKFVASEEGTVTYKEVKGEWTVLQLVKDDAGTVFSFKGLDDGEYRIIETLTPTGYNPIEPIYFTVTAEHSVDPAALELTGLNATVVKEDGVAYTEEELLVGNIATFNVTLKEGSLTTEVVNNSGALLPETGGIGTTFFYVLGSVLVVGAVVLMVTRKRMSSN